MACGPDSHQDLNDALIDQYTETHPPQEQSRSGYLAAPDNSAHGFSGEWQYLDGRRVCDGYMTRNFDEEFCEAEVPEDWLPFTYDGETYFVQPLSGAGE